MKLYTVLIALLLAGSTFMNAQSDLSHPRLFLRAGQEKALLANIRKDSIWNEMHNEIIKEAEVICGLDMLQRKVVGPRMHAISCEALRRVLFLSYSYRMTGREEFAVRAEKEMLHLSGFVDYNPSHFLDTSEMGVALSIGYDWLFDWLNPQSKEVILKAIQDKVLTTGITGGEGDQGYNLRWLERANNWNQVCNGGLTVASIATYTENQELSETIIKRSCEAILIPMEWEYAPMGCFPEGFGYWAFGTQFNILFVDAMEKFFGPESVVKYKEMPGFIQSGHYSQQLITPSLRTFGYSDNSTRIYLEPAVMWFNTVKPDPAMYYMQKRLFYKFQKSASYVKTIKNRLIPFMLIWGAGTGDEPAVCLNNPEYPTETYYLGQGKNDICVMRSGWTKDDVYLGFKAGRVRSPHGHMDVGSFYYEVDSVRWSLDLGSDDYGKIALANVNMFDMTPGSPRWHVLTKYNNFAHSTTFPEGVHQQTKPTCPMTGSREKMQASTSFACLYPKQLDSLVRTVSLKDRSAVIEDFVMAGNSEVEMVWNMTTEGCDLNRKGKNLTLTNPDGKVLDIKVKTQTPFRAELVPAERKNKFEGLNKGIYWLRIIYNVPAQCSEKITVTMTPRQ